MASKYYGDLVFSTGEYEMNGQKKKRWSKSGTVFEDPETGRLSIKFEAIPAGEWSGWMRIFEKDNNNQNNQKSKQNKTDNEPISLNDIPF
ncbi:hypothetical protein EOL73_04030 [Candidatus Saccharibacteria bacterium]|nr:hypothetical protein [Candidatus Saccharibacteria bacterium]